MILLAVSLAPILLLLIYLYRRDKYEKEPQSLLLKVFILGALTVIPILFIELWLGNYWDAKYNYQENKMQTAAFNAFAIAALTEEFFKFLVFVFIIWRNKNFNEKFDGIIYAVYISLGFAAIENIMYVINNGMGTGIVRAFTAVPAHAIFGTTMGYFLGKAKFSVKSKAIFLLLSLIAPIILHGIYDFIIMSQNETLLTVFVPYVILMLIIALKQMKSLSNASKFKPLK